MRALSIEERVQLAQQFRDDWRSIHRDIGYLKDRLSGLEDAAKQIVGEQPHVTSAGATIEAATWSPSRCMTEWLDRQRLLGLISAEGIATVEKLIAEVG